MSTRFTDYNEAARFAAQQVTKYGRDYGIRHCREFGRDGYNVSSLPAPSHTFGSDLYTAERVTPEAARIILAMYPSESTTSDSDTTTANRID